MIFIILQSHNIVNIQLTFSINYCYSRLILFFTYYYMLNWAFPIHIVDYQQMFVKEMRKGESCNTGEPGSTPGLGRSAGEGVGYPLQYSWALLVAQLVICLQCGRAGFSPWVEKIPWRRERVPTPVLWPGEFHGLYSPWGHKESDMMSDFHFHFNRHTWYVNCVKNLKLPLNIYFLQFNVSKIDPQVQLLS